MLVEIHCFDRLPAWIVREQPDNLNDMQPYQTSGAFMLLVSPLLLVARRVL